MRKFNISVNGTSYEVEVEEIGGGYSAPAPVAASAPAAAAPKAAPKKAAAPVAAGEQVTAPMPGNIWQVVASVGQEVAEGDVVLVLEAMKMENEIMAPKAGKVASINVEKGDSVEAGQVLFVIA
ncbi:MAG: biotin/lipoyl-containing protein [Eubacteriales bacterium]